ncbi:MAG: FAD-binding protein [Candidatus Sericytochromatia bacterium]|nr:FAD-binding protein [Candidatus Sericytochromatia bacterium]
MSRSSQILIIGGGLAGLACALKLQQAGRDWSLSVFIWNARFKAFTGKALLQDGPEYLAEQIVLAVDPAQTSRLYSVGDCTPTDAGRSDLLF